MGGKGGEQKKDEKDLTVCEVCSLGRFLCGGPVSVALSAKLRTELMSAETWTMVRTQV